MKPALVIGNGRSRLEFDLNELRKHFVTYGCNAIYRDFIPDYLIAMDPFMVAEIIRAKVHYKTKFYTQHYNDIDKLAISQPINFITNKPSTPDSGSAATELASIEHKTIYMIGFDYHNGYFNNVYSGTTNYHYANTQISQQQDTKMRSTLYGVINKYLDVQYIRVSDDKQNSGLNNYSTMSIEAFKELVC